MHTHESSQSSPKTTCMFTLRFIQSKLHTISTDQIRRRKSCINMHALQFHKYGSSPRKHKLIVHRFTSGHQPDNDCKPFLCDCNNLAQMEQIRTFAMRHSNRPPAQPPRNHTIAGSLYKWNRPAQSRYTANTDAMQSL